MHKTVQVFEFYLPLTHERRLRETLDRLFYADTVRQRLEEIGADRLSKHVSRKRGEDDDAYYDRLVQLVADTFGGYSISHVSGRFRAATLLSLQDAAEHMAQGEAYLVDETTAVVKFIVPCQSGVPLDADASEERQDEFFAQLLDDPADTRREANELRTLFYLIFVTAVVRLVRNEDEIWLLESGLHNKLVKFVAKPDQ